MTDNADEDDFTIDDVIYWMGWHMDSQRRMYDVLLSIFAASPGGGSLKAKELQQMHAAGKFLYPPAYTHMEDPDETD